MSIQDSAQEGTTVQPDRAVAQASPHDVIGLGLAFAAAGLYVTLGAAGYAPMPENNSPAFIVFCAGAAFLFAGLTCMVRARAGILNIESPDNAPRQASYRMLAIGAAGALAIIGTYVAIGSGPRVFSRTAPFVEMQTMGELLGRTLFGLGAVIVLIMVMALTVGTVRKLFDRRGERDQTGDRQGVRLRRREGGLPAHGVGRALRQDRDPGELSASRGGRTACARCRR